MQIKIQNTLFLIILIVSSTMISSLKIKNQLNLSNPTKSSGSKYSELLPLIRNPPKNLFNADEICKKFFFVKIVMKELQEQEDSEEIITAAFKDNNTKAEKNDIYSNKKVPLKNLNEGLREMSNEMDLKTFKELQKNFQKAEEVKKIQIQCEYILLFIRDIKEPVKTNKSDTSNSKDKTKINK